MHPYIRGMSKGKVLVTGGAGFIGSHTVVELVAAGYAPVIVDNLVNSDRKALAGIAALVGHEVPFYEVDCTDAKSLNAVFEQEAPFAGVIHFAAFKAVGESVERPTAYFRNNIDSTAVLLDAMAAHPSGRLVFSSSCTVYGEPAHIPVDETAAIRPAESPYGFTKQACERLIGDQVHAAPDFHATLLRYFNPIGAHPSAQIGELPLGRPNNLIPFLTQAVAGLREPLTVFGDDYPTPDGTCIRDYIHVVDLAKAHVAALSAEATGERLAVYNLGTGNGASVKEVVAAFETATGRAVPHRMGPRRTGDVVAIYADAEKAARELGWRTERSLEEALADAWRWQEALAAH